MGDLTSSRDYCAGQNSFTHGYTSGGSVSGGAPIVNIDKFSFSTNANATDVGDMTHTTYSQADNHQKHMVIIMVV